MTAVPLIHIQARNAELAGGTVAEVQLGGGGPAASGVNVQGGCNPQVDLVGSEQIRMIDVPPTIGSSPSQGHGSKRREP
ncbi:hypothetical protein GCM10009712_20610 [Pseudarthrobacter sulfonivorans]